MSVEIRRGTIHDIDAIAEIIKLAFDDIVDKERVKQLLTLSHNYVCVAVQSGVVVGFVENFMTVSQDNHIRLELDLLAVHPMARGQGIGKRLIQTSIDKAKQLGVDCLRALIASENRIMQHACKRQDLIQSQDEYGLYVISPQDISEHITETLQAHLILIETLTYTGIWLEGDITASAVDNANVIVKQNQYDIIGAVVNKTHAQTIELLADNQFVHVNDYHHWTLNLKSD
jgi:N-acetylglutamate synthase-like GNAT family acetyltransferase